MLLRRAHTATGQRMNCTGADPQPDRCSVVDGKNSPVPLQASFASRMSHSCTPNCQALVVTVGGRLTIAMYSVRDIMPGEELTFDYASVTESEKDFRGAVCLCSSRRCRGSYLTFAGSTAFTKVGEERTRRCMWHERSVRFAAGLSALASGCVLVWVGIAFLVICRVVAYIHGWVGYGQGTSG